MGRMTRSLENLGIGVILGGALGFLAPIGAVAATLAAVPFSGTTNPAVMSVIWLPIVAIMTSIAGVVLGIAAWVGAGLAALLSSRLATGLTARVIAVGFGAMLGATAVVAAAASLRGFIVDLRYGVFAIALAGGLAATVIVVRSTTDERRVTLRN